MTMVDCPVCKSPVSVKAKDCPHCGEPDPSRKKRDAERLKNTLLLIVIGCAIAYFWFTGVPDIREHGLFHQMGKGQ